jgi:hypothetical protein
VIQEQRGVRGGHELHAVAGGVEQIGMRLSLARAILAPPVRGIPQAAEFIQQRVKSSGPDTIGLMLSSAAGRSGT